MGPAIYTLASLAEKFLAWCRNHRSPRTVDWYRGYLTKFLRHLGEAASMPVAELRPFHVIEWIDAQQGWGDTYKRGAIIAVQRMCNWAEELGYIAASPVKKIKKPPAGRRDNPMSEADFQQILRQLRHNDPFRELLLFVWHSGCRPQEARHIEARHVNLEAECIVIPKEEAKGRRRARVILLHGPALQIIKRLTWCHPEGKLFRNRRGKPWTKYAICNRMHRLSERLGRPVAMYDARHGFCQRLLEKGINHLAVAELMGHANGQMVSAVYSHMNRATAHLKDALKKADGEAPAS